MYFLEKKKKKQTLTILFTISNIYFCHLSLKNMFLLQLVQNCSGKEEDINFHGGNFNKQHPQED